MKNLIVVLVLLFATGAFAKDKIWQDGQVMRMDGSIPQRGFYWIRGTSHSYLIRNAANGHVVQWWVRLTLGDTVRISSDGKNLKVIDNTNKERTCQILQEVTNRAYEAFAAHEAAKTPEQLASEKALQLQQEALRLQAIQTMNATRPKLEFSPSPPIKPLPSSPVPPSQSVHCTTRTVNNVTYTDCN